MIGDKTQIEIFGRPMTVEMDGLTPMEVSALAQTVTDKMRELQESSGIADTYKLAALAALDLAAELHQLKESLKSFQEFDEKKLDELTKALHSVLDDAETAARP